MKYTLLQQTQNILSSMSSDEVNSINDTTESQQIALICQTVYYDMATELRLPEHDNVFELTASGDASKPTVMYLPDFARNIQWLKYNARIYGDTVDTFKTIDYLPINDFFDRIYSYDMTQDNVLGFDVSANDNDTITIQCRTDIAPQYYSTYNDNTILFDSYDSEVDTTLQKTKTLAFGSRNEVFTLADDFTPNLDEQAFALYYNECKSLAWMELKEIPHSLAERTAKRQRTVLQRDKTALGDKRSKFARLPNYGRK